MSALDIANGRRALRSTPAAAFRIWTRLRMALWRARLAALGPGSTIYPSAIIRVPRSVAIGSDVTINDFVHIWGGGGVEIGDGTMVAAHAVITSQSHAVDAPRRGARYRDTHVSAPVRIGRNVWIGSAAVILPGVVVGDDAIVGASSLVTRDVPPGTVAYGVPAKPRRLVSHT